MNVVEEANRIKARLRACQSGEEIERIAAEEREKVIAMKGQSAESNAMYLQVVNLKSYMLRFVIGG